ncbi:hypothetical protein QFC19_007135 [Naganishia cerealis]|uniref:Uncharacterized protein n=1 Tax=Naganishia cerealis TaxID=610337 RepID=A0ACC2VDG6_9TREE|nr:hypothetical protein QFC19_007135 [Naganishia cerealis]
MPKATKQTKKFVSSGKLKQTLEKRKKYKQVQKKVAGREARKANKERNGKGKHADEDSDEDEEDDFDAPVESDEDASSKKNKGKGKAVDDDEDSENAEAADLNGEDDDDDDTISSLGEEDFDLDDEQDSVEMDDPDVDAAEMAKQLAELEKKDPEFYKYLRENDADLLAFGQEEDEVVPKSKKASKTKGKVAEEENEDEDMDEYDGGDSDSDEEEPEFEGISGSGEPEKISVTMKMLRGWQRAMIEHHSLRSLRKMVLAFRAAAHMNEEGQEDFETRYKVDSALVFNKLILTALKFTPVVLAKHIPYKELPSGRFKVSKVSKSQARLPQFIKSHFSTLMFLIKSLPSAPTTVNDEDDSSASSLLHTAVAESTKLLPWVMDNKKQLKAYLKLLLELWSSSADNVRIACFLAVRKVYKAGDQSMKELCLKNIYSALLPPLRLTSAHTLPAINLMKNTAAELYQLDPEISYTHAFGYIRMLAVHLRGVVRSGQADKEAFRAVYNWQFVHCLDFWSLVLAGSCDREKIIAGGGQASALEPLIYPLVQIAIGVVRLVPTSRWFPLRFHVLHALLRINARTGNYVPLAPFLLEILESNEFKRAKPKNASLKPLDLEYAIKAPASYPKTKVYQETLAEELIFILGEFHSVMSTNIAFPEMTIPVVFMLKRYLKKGGASGKVNNQLKTLVEKIEVTRQWIEKNRRNVSFAPNDRAEVEAFLDGTPITETPIGSWMRLQKKVRDQKRKEIEMAQREENTRAPVASDDDEDDEDEDDEDDEEEYEMDDE